MSNAILLACLTGGTGQPWTPPDSGDAPPPGETVGGLPALTDPTAQALRPDGRLIGTLTVGPSGRDHTTIRDALSRAAAMQRARASADGITWPTLDQADQLAAMRDYRVDVIIDPGTYPEGGTTPLDAPAHVALYAADGGHSTVTVGVAINTNGWNYQEGLRVVPPKDGTAGKYASHHSNRGTTIWSRCTLDTEGRSGGGGGDVPIGMDGAAHGHLCLYDVSLRGSWANLHGWAEMLTPEEVCLVRLDYPDGRVQYSALNDTTPSEVWVVDSTLRALVVNGSAMISHVSGSTIAGGYTPTDARSDWPVPVGGISPTWRARLT